MKKIKKIAMIAHDHRRKDLIAEEINYQEYIDRSIEDA